MPVRWLAFLALVLFATRAYGQETAFRWVNPLPSGAYPRLEHGTYASSRMDLRVGYVVCVPPGYEDPENAARRYPVVYFLPGGRVGSETSYVGLADVFHEWVVSGVVPPRLWVFVNGGPEGYFDYGASRAESSFVEELIPHIDRTYRTVGTRDGRALEGFSMGRRAAARIALKYPQLFGSTAFLSGGHQKEELISIAGGREDRGDVVLVHEPTSNSWDLARLHAQRAGEPGVSLLVVVGTEDPNHQGNLDWMEHLSALGIPFERQVVPNAPHDVVRLLDAI